MVSPPQTMVPMFMVRVKFQVNRTSDAQVFTASLNGTKNAEIRTSGAATFAGQLIVDRNLGGGNGGPSILVQDGGVLNTRLNNDGSAWFAGLVDIGSATSPPAGNYGLIVYSSADGASNNSTIFARNMNAAGRNYVGADNSGTTTFEVFGNGSTAFAGEVSVGTGLTISAPSGVGTAFIYGPDAIIIDPSPIGDPSGVVRIRGDLFVEGTETVINSDTLKYFRLYYWYCFYSNNKYISRWVWSYFWTRI